MQPNVSREREELAKILDDVIANPHREARRKMWNALPLIATALRTQHQTPPSVTDEMVEALKRIRDTAMEHTLTARIPESGVFGGIAQDADWLMIEITAAMSGGVDESNTDPDSPTGYVKGSEFPRLTPSGTGDTTQLLAECYARLNDHYWEASGSPEEPPEPGDEWSYNIIPLFTAIQRATGKDHAELMALGNTPPTAQER